MTKTNDDPFEAFCAEVLDRIKWRTNPKGTRYRTWGGNNVSVFFRSGVWVWCISYGPDDCKFSPCKYETEDDAKDGLCLALWRE